MNNIENKIVEMKFDNEQFESAVAKTMSTLDKFKEKLNFEGAGKGLDKAGKAASDVQYSLNDVGRSLESLNDRFSATGIIGMTVMQNLTNAAMNFVTNGLGKIKDMVVGGGISRAMNLEKARFQISGLKDKKGRNLDANKIINEGILPSLLGTPFSLDEAAVVISSMAASGITDVKDIQEVTKSIAGVAAMTSSSFAQIGNIYTKIKGQGKMMGQELNQLATYGMNAAATIAEYLTKIGDGAKVTEQDVREMVTAGEISFDIFSAAMGDAFGEHATKSTEMFSGALDDLKAAMARIGAEPAGAALVFLRDVFNSLVPAVDAVNAVLKPFTNAVKTDTKDYGILTKKVQGLSLGFQKLFLQMEQVEDKEGNLVWQAKRYAEGTANAGDKVMNSNMRLSLEYLTEAFINLNKAIASVIGPMAKGIAGAFPKLGLKNVKNFAQGIRDFTKALILSQDNMDRLQAVTQGVFTPIGMVLKGIIALAQGLVLVIKQLFRAISPTLNAVFAFMASVGQTVSSVGNMITELISASIQMGTFGINTLGAVAKLLKLDVVAGLIQKGFYKLAEIFDKVRVKLQAFFADFGNNARNLAQRVADFLHLQEVVEKLQAAFIKLGEGIRQMLHLDEILPILQSIFKTFVDFFSQNAAFAILLENLKNFVEWIGKLIPFDSILTGLSNAFDKLVGSVSKLTSGPASKVKTWLAEVGRNVKEFFKSLNDGGAFIQLAKSIFKPYKALKTVQQYLNVVIIPMLQALGYIIPKLFGFETFGEMVAAAGKKIHSALAAFGRFFGLIAEVGKTKSEEKLKSLKGALQDLFSNKILGSMAKFGDAVRSLGKSVGDKLATVLEYLGVLFESADPKAAKKVVTTFALLALAFHYIKTMRSIAFAMENWGKLALNIGTFVSNITSGFGLTKVTKAIASTVKLVGLATSLLIFAGAVYILSKMDWQQVLIGSGVMLAALVAFWAVLKAIDKMDSADRGDKVKNLTIAILAIGAGMFLMVKALQTLVDVFNQNSPEAYIGALLSVVGLLYAFVFAAKILAGVKGEGVALGKASFAILGIAKGMEIMAKACNAFAEIPEDKFWKGLAAIVSIFGMFALFAYAVRAQAKVFSAAMGMIALAGAIFILYKAMKLIGDALTGDTAEAFQKGAVAVGVMLAALTAFAGIAGAAEGGIFAASVGMLAIAAAIAIIAKVMDYIGNMDTGVFEQGSAAIVAMLAAFVLFAKFASKDAAVTAASMLAIAVGVIAVSEALKILSGIPFGTLIAALLKFGLVIVIFAAAIAVLQFAAKFITMDQAAGIIAVGAALLLLAGALALIAAIPIPMIVVALVALVVTMVAVGVVLMAFSSVSIGLIAVAGAFALLGAAAIMVGAGLMLFVMALTALIPLLLALSMVDTDMLSQGLNVLKMTAEGLADALKILAIGVLAFGAACIVAAVGLIGVAAGIALIGVACVAAALGITILSGSLALLALTIQKFFGGGMLEMIGSGFDGFAAGFKEKVTGLFSSFKGMFSKDKGKELTSDFYDGMEEGAEEGESTAGPSIKDAITSPLDEILDNKGLMLDDYNSLGQNIPLETADGISMNEDEVRAQLKDMMGDNTKIFNQAKSDAKKGGKGVGKGFASGEAAASGDVSKSANKLVSNGVTPLAKGANKAKSEGGKTGGAYAHGIKGKTGEAKTAASNMESQSRAQLAQHQKTWGTLGSNAGSGYAQGIRGKIAEVCRAAASLVRQAIASAKAAQDSNSPSKEYAKLGKWADEGYISGMKSLAAKVAATSEEVIGGGLQSVSDAMTEIGEMFTADMDFTPTITPVVDLTNVRQTAGDIDRIIGSTYEMTSPLAGYLNASRAAASFSDMRIGSVDSIDKLSKKIDSMTETMNSRSLNVYNTIDGASDPELFADQLVRSFRLNARTI